MQASIHWDVKWLIYNFNSESVRLNVNYRVINSSIDSILMPFLCGPPLGLHSAAYYVFIKCSVTIADTQRGRWMQ